MHRRGGAAQGVLAQRLQRRFPFFDALCNFCPQALERIVHGARTGVYAA